MGCERNVCKKLREAKETAREGTSVNDVFCVHKGVVTAVAAEMLGYEVFMARRKRSA